MSSDDIFKVPSTERRHRVDPKRRKPDITLAKDILNWKPKKKLALGLKETIVYFKKKLNFR